MIPTSITSSAPVARCFIVSARAQEAARAWLGSQLAATDLFPEIWLPLSKVWSLKFEMRWSSLTRRSAERPIGLYRRIRAL